MKRTGSKTDVVEGKLGNPWVELQEQGQWLTDTTGGTENGDLRRLQSPSLASCYSTFI
jgi:hypothetical protein